MSTLWTFGDSFTAGEGCMWNLPIRDGGCKYYNEYKRKEDNIWPELLAKKLGFELKNLGLPGASNDKIIDILIDNFFDIKPDDIVIISKTYDNRFDIPNNNNKKFKTIFAESLATIKKNLEESHYNNNKIEMETILNFGLLFMTDNLYEKRNDKRLNFFTKLLINKGNNAIFWNINSPLIKSFESIYQATNGEIKDYHFSFKGHRDFADMLYKKLINPSLI